MLRTDHCLGTRHRKHVNPGHYATSSSASSLSRCEVAVHDGAIAEAVGAWHDDVDAFAAEQHCRVLAFCDELAAPMAMYKKNGLRGHGALCI